MGKNVLKVSEITELFERKLDQKSKIAIHAGKKFTGSRWENVEISDANEETL